MSETRLQVLVVDDDAVMGELLTALMSIEGYGVAHANGGEEAMTMLRGQTPKPDVVLCDIHMPGLDGAELARLLVIAREEGELPSETVLMAMSGSAPRGDEAKAFDGFLRKPFAIEDFTQAVEDARAKRPVAQASVADEGDSSPGDLPPLDDYIFGQLQSKLGGALLRQLYEMTMEDVRDRVDRIAAAAQRGDGTTVHQESHTIKGSCGMVGAKELQALATATEGGSVVDTSTLADFRSACQRLERILNERLQAP